MVGRQEKKRIRKTTQEVMAHPLSIKIARAGDTGQGYRKLNIIIQDADTGEQVGFVSTARKPEAVGQLLDDIREIAVLPRELLSEIPHKSAAGEKDIQYWLDGRGEGGRPPGRSETAQGKRREVAQDYWDTVDNYHQLEERMITRQEFADSKDVSVSTLQRALEENPDLKR